MLAPINIRPKARMADRSNGISTLKGRGMSALGQKRTFAVQYVMSALPPKADMCGALGDVRYVPIADIAYLFDHLVGAGEQRRRHVRPRAFAVLRSMTRSNLVGACTGRSAGFSPLRMRST